MSLYNQVQHPTKVLDSVIDCYFPSRTLLRPQWQILKIICPLSTLGADFDNVWLRWLPSFVLAMTSDCSILPQAAPNYHEKDWPAYQVLHDSLISVLKSLGQWVKLNFIPSRLVSRIKLWLENTITFIQQSKVSVCFSINYRSPWCAMDLSNYICEHLIAFFSMFLAVALCTLLLQWIIPLVKKATVCRR